MAIPHLIFDFVQVLGTHRFFPTISPQISSDALVQFFGESLGQSISQRLGHDAPIIIQLILVFFAAMKERQRNGNGWDKK